MKLMSNKPEAKIIQDDTKVLSRHGFLFKAKNLLFSTSKFSLTNYARETSHEVRNLIVISLYGFEDTEFLEPIKKPSVICSSVLPLI